MLKMELNPGLVMFGMHTTICKMTSIDAGQKAISHFKSNACVVMSMVEKQMPVDGDAELMCTEVFPIAFSKFTGDGAG